MHAVLQDFVFSLRSLARRPSFALTAVLMLGVGLGSAAAVFTLLDALLWRPLSIHQPDRVVRLVVRQETARTLPFSRPMFDELSRSLESVEGLFGSVTPAVTVKIDDAVEGAGGLMLSGPAFQTLGVGASVGRVLAPQDDKPGSGAVMLTHDYWVRRFGADPGVVGKTIELEWRPYTIVGVAAKGFTGMQPGIPCELILPLSHIAELRQGPDWDGRRILWIGVHGRLADGVRLDQARAELRARWPAILEATAPTDFTPERRRQFMARTVDVESAARGFSTYQGRFEEPLLVLGGVVGVLLLIVCVNIANLMLAQAMVRQRETAIRLAVGAGRSRIFRQAVFESVLLAAAGATAGAVLSSWVGQALMALWNNGPARIALDLRLDLRVFAFLAASALGASLLAGLAPAIWTALSAPATPLQTARSGGRRRLQGALLATQTAFSIMLLAGAALLATSLRNLRVQPVDYRTERVALLSLAPVMGGYGDTDFDSYYSRLLTAVRATPGIEAAAMANHHPTGVWPLPADVQGEPGESPEGLTSTSGCVSPVLFETLGTPLLSGRTFTPTDSAGAPKTVILNHTLAQSLFPGVDPIGRLIGFAPEADRRDLTVVGVVRDSGYRGFRNGDSAALYTPCAQQAGFRRGSLTLFVRTAGSPAAVLPELRRRIESLGVESPVRVTTMRQQAEQTLARERTIAWVASVFAAMALMLVAIGLYGMLAFLVRSRTREIGVRMALGADRRRLLGWVLGKAVWIALAGVAAGVPLALATARYTESLLFGVEPGSLVAPLAAGVLVTLVALAAALAPARRAAALEPMDALRTE